MSVAFSAGRSILREETMSAMPAISYSDLRNQLLRESFPNVFAPALLRDAESNYIPLPIHERLVQCIWYDQRLRLEALRTVDDQRVEVIFPGWWNLEAGPDFRNATLKIGDEPERQGDIEIHLRAEDWAHHGHDHDPRYDNVILHVVLWEATGGKLSRTRHGDEIPQLVLHPHLAAPLEQLFDEIDSDAYPHNVGNHAGQCADALLALPAETVAALFNAAGDERFAGKTRRFARWIHRVGAEQAFYEGWMEALGYKANKTAFRALAQRVPLTTLAESRVGAALLFGAGNLLPTVAAKGSDVYARRLWAQWWKLRPEFFDKILPAEAWRLAGIRPANHPHRRLGAAAALLRRHENFAAKAIAAVESHGDPAKLFLQVRDEYWSRHFTLGGKAQAQPAELIGAARAQEIVANIVLPFVAAYAASRQDDRLQAQAKARYDALRPSGDNSLARLATHQLFGTTRVMRRYVQTTRQQQGLLQILQDFCFNDKSVCRQCRFAELARRWPAATGSC